MYTLNEDKIKGKYTLLDLDGYRLPSRNKYFMIKGAKIKNITVTSTNLLQPIMSKKVNAEYAKLIKYLTELLVSDDDSGEAFTIALNEIEKFRLIIKNKYRQYLSEKELEHMAKQLRALQKAAKEKLNNLQEDFLLTNERTRGR
jgi:hypothetical protein